MRYLLTIAILLAGVLAVSTSGEAMLAQGDEYTLTLSDGASTLGFALAGFDAESSRSMRDEDVTGSYDHDRADMDLGDFDRSRDAMGSESYENQE